MRVLAVSVCCFGLIGALQKVHANESPQSNKNTLGVFVECQSERNIPVCDYIEGYINKYPVLRQAPLSDAEVTLFVNVTRRGLEEWVHLRTRSNVEELSLSFETTEEINSRLSVDEHREKLLPVFLRALSPHLATHVPTAMHISLIDQPEEEKPQDLSPYSFVIWAGGWGYWTQDYQNGDAYTGTAISRIERRYRYRVSVQAYTNWEKLPPLVVDGTTIPLSVSSHGYELKASFAKDFTDDWSWGGILRGGRQDPESLFDKSFRSHLGIERNFFASDDLRGNRLAITYLIGGQLDYYNQQNVLEQSTAMFPTHTILFNGGVRKDYTEYDLSVKLIGEVLKPSRRYVASLNAGVSFILGPHVDIALGAGITRQAIPGPLNLDVSNYEQVAQANYAEPLSINGDINIRLHWDPTNGIPNNRFRNLRNLDPLDNL